MINAFHHGPTFLSKRPSATTNCRAHEIGFSAAIESCAILIGAADDAIPLQPEIQAEVLTDMAHVALDFSTFFRPNKAALRLLTVVGRLSVLTADYLPDHSILPEELVIQLFLLGVSTLDVVKSVASIASNITHCQLE